MAEEFLKFVYFSTLELKIEANPPEWVLLYDLVEEFVYDIEERRYFGVKMVISYVKLFSNVTKTSTISSYGFPFFSIVLMNSILFIFIIFKTIKL